MRILVLSRNASLYSTNRLVLTARARGHEISVIDPLSLQIVVSRGAPRLSLGGERLPKFDAVIPRIGASITRYGAAVLRQFEHTGTIVLNNAQAISLTRDKVGMLQMLANERVPVPRTVCTRSLAGVEAALELVGGYPAIIKLQQGAQGIGTMIAESPQSLYALLETLWAMGQEIVLQQYIKESRGRDVRAIVVDGKVVAAMRRTAQSDEFRSNLHRGARGDALRLPRRYKNCALKATAISGLDFVGVDMLEGKSGPIVVELNSSPGLEGIEAATEVDVAAAIISLAEKRFAAKRRARARTKQRANKRK